MYSYRWLLASGREGMPPQGIFHMGSIPSDRDANLSLRNSRGRLVNDLRRQLGSWEATGALEEAATFSCGASAIDRLLPGDGLRHGMLIEWLAGSNSEPSSKAPSPGRGAVALFRRERECGDAWFAQRA